VAADAYRIADGEAGLLVGDRLVMTAQQGAAGDHLGGFTQGAGLDAGQHDANIPTLHLNLHGQVGDIGRFGHAGQAGQGSVDIISNRRGFGPGAEGVLLYHPQVGARGGDDGAPIGDHAAIDAGHGQGDADQQAEPDAGEEEAAEVMADVAGGEIDHCLSPLAAVMRTRSPLVRGLAR